MSGSASAKSAKSLFDKLGGTKSIEAVVVSPLLMAVSIPPGAPQPREPLLSVVYAGSGYPAIAAADGRREHVR